MTDDYVSPNYMQYGQTENAYDAFLISAKYNEDEPIVHCSPTFSLYLYLNRFTSYCYLILHSSITVCLIFKCQEPKRIALLPWKSFLQKGRLGRRPNQRNDSTYCNWPNCPMILENDHFILSKFSAKQSLERSKVACISPKF